MPNLLHGFKQFPPVLRIGISCRQIIPVAVVVIGRATGPIRNASASGAVYVRPGCGALPAIPITARRYEAVGYGPCPRVGGIIAAVNIAELACSRSARPGRCPPAPSAVATHARYAPRRARARIIAVKSA